MTMLTNRVRARVHQLLSEQQSAGARHAAVSSYVDARLELSHELQRMHAADSNTFSLPHSFLPSAHCFRVASCDTEQPFRCTVKFQIYSLGLG